MKIVAASDSFKGSLTSLEVAEYVELGVHDIFPCGEVIKLCVADGGEGTVDALYSNLSGKTISIQVSDPLGRKIQASYFMTTDGHTAVVEMSAASGLPLLDPSEYNPMKTSTYGTGELISDALSRGCRRFLVGIGGSATNDAGMGMLAALGYRFYDSQGQNLDASGSSLSLISGVDVTHAHPALAEAEFIVACDVDSPMYGPDGAAYIYAPQKGADEHMVRLLDNGLRHFSSIAVNETGKDISELPGAGAAGGLGGCFVAFLNASLTSGADLILDAIGFDDIIEGADLVVTGEGRMDSQTLRGKLPFKIMSRAASKGVPCAAVCGSCVLDKSAVGNSGFYVVHPVTPVGVSLEKAMQPSTAGGNIGPVAKYA
ncbi:MAG: glycerate kinase [Bacteroidales bacterium]|nr:glycerate kinase [Bacteroidales bacterium]